NYSRRQPDGELRSAKLIASSKYVVPLSYECQNQTKEQPSPNWGRDIWILYHAPSYAPRADCKNPLEVLREYKMYTARMMLGQLRANTQENRREWILAIMSKVAEKHSQHRNYRFWQHHTPV